MSESTEDISIGRAYENQACQGNKL